MPYPTVRYHAHHLELSGYGRAAAGYIQALRIAGVSVDVVPVEGAMMSTKTVDVAIYHTTPGRLKHCPRSPARKHITLTTWETDPMPEEHVQTLWAHDAVIVPSEFCKQLIHMPSARDEECLKRNTHVVPHGFDPSVWTPSENGPQTGQPAILDFYSIGAWGERKNTLGLLKAYLHAFRKKDRTRLTLVVDKVNMTAVKSLIARSLIPQDELPGLYIPDHRLSDEELIQLHRNSHCLVTATRSEGFGLPIFEAAIMGKPIIATNWGGQGEFLECHPQFWEVEHQLTPVFPGEDSLTVSPEGQARLEMTLPQGANSSQLWAEPDLESLARLMKMVHWEFQAGTLKDDHSHRNWYENNYRFSVIGTKFANVLKEILG